MRLHKCTNMGAERLVIGECLVAQQLLQIEVLPYLPHRLLLAGLQLFLDDKIDSRDPRVSAGEPVQKWNFAAYRVSILSQGISFDRRTQRLSRLRRSPSNG